MINNISLYNIDIFNIILLSVLLLLIKQTKNKIKYFKYFNIIIYLNIFLLFMDCIKLWFDSNRSYNIANTSYIFYILYYGLFNASMYSFFYYFSRLIHYKPLRSNWYKILYFLPYIISLFFLKDIRLASIVYINFLISISIATLLLMINHVLNENRFYIDRIKFITIPIIPLIGLLIYIIDPGFSISCGIVLSCIIGYINSIDLLICTDSLTQINNRHNLIENINYKIKVASKANYPLFIIMIDIDNFKNINDTYGHIEGDKCLIRLAEVLKTCCNSLSRRAFICRYGGDEFLIAVDCQEEEVYKLRDLINTELEEKNIHDGCKYDFYLSSGVAKYDSVEHTSVKSFIDCADKILYENKKEKKSLRV